MGKSYGDIEVLNAFGLTSKQTALLFSLQKACANNDMATSKLDKAAPKKEWIERWSSIVSQPIEEEGLSLINGEDLVQAFERELSQSTSKIWFHLIILEAVTFTAYFQLGNDNDKKYKKLSYQEQLDFLKIFIAQVGYGKPEIVDRYHKSYKSARNKATGRTKKIIINTLVVLLAAAVIAATAGAAAPKIAVFLVGGKFAGLSGAALISASLAFLGGGAVVAGGAGMAGGVLVIVGGGALLGAAVGGAGIAGKELLFGASPDFALTSAAKLDVVLREIILNEQRDIKLAQAILENYKENIVQLHSQIAKLQLEKERDKAQLKNMKKSLEYMERVFKDMNVFTSSFEIGMAAYN